jgi:hypothetical protein
MTVDRYIFQSPYSNQFQVGKPDPSATSKEDNSNISTEIVKGPDQVAKQAPVFQTPQVEETQETQPETTDTNKLLNLYA